ncbi:MAG: MinD/ParA family protein, partial [Anaerolineae bacterium]|nr:MinD/ParA family protein [Anaerolineae bacterium]
NVPRLVIVVNKTPLVYDFEQVKSQVEQLYSAEVAAVMPHSDEMMALASAGVFVLRYPDHEMTRLYRQIAQKLMS